MFERSARKVRSYARPWRSSMLMEGKANRGGHDGPRTIAPPLGGVGDGFGESADRGGISEGAAALFPNAKETDRSPPPSNQARLFRPRNPVATLAAPIGAMPRNQRCSRCRVCVEHQRQYFFSASRSLVFVLFLTVT